MKKSLRKRVGVWLLVTVAAGAAIVALNGDAMRTGGVALAAQPASKPGAAGTPAGTAAKPASNVILRMAKQWEDPAKDVGGTIWRYYETWRTDVARADDGALVLVQPYVFRRGGKTPATGPAVEIAAATEATGSAFPPEGWQKADFDDADWQRQPGPLRTKYRSLALTCIRGKFEVRDGAAVAGLALDVSFQGGAVAYLNGQEVGRAGLPAGAVKPDALADDYPKETDESGVAKSGGGLINQTLNGGEVIGRDVPPRWPYGAATQECDLVAAHYRQRFRSLRADIPASALRPGVNVLAIEVHRAPAHPALFTGLRYERDTDGNAITNWAWNRCMIDDVTLTATAPAAGIVPNVARPAGMQVWNCSTQFKLAPTHYGDPNEPLRPIRMFGLPNGLYSGRFVVNSTGAIAGLKVTASDLKADKGGAIPAASVRVGYERWFRGESDRHGFDAIDDAPPAEIAPGAMRYYPRWAPCPGAMQPVWVTVRVPRDAKPGEYAGTLRVEAAGEKATEVPLKLRVVSDWALPDPPQFTTFVGAIQSPDSVALQYKVPMWSEAHWKLLDRTFALLGEIGVRDVHIPLIAKTNLGNEQSMVRWVKQADGSAQPDFAIAERYLDLACKHLGKPPIVAIWVHDRPFYRSDGPMLAGGQVVKPEPDMAFLPYTQVDPATGATTEQRAPAWGTPEARAFWKPAIESARAMLAQRGLEKSMVFGAATQSTVGVNCLKDLQALAPDIKWYNRTHGMNPRTVGPKSAPQEVRYCSEGHTCHLSVDWDPDTDPKVEGRYVWTKPAGDGLIATTSAWHLTDTAELSTFRTFAEATLLSRWYGISTQGVDFWPNLRPTTPGGGGTTLIQRYTWQFGVDCGYTQHALLGAGADGPAATPRLHLMREALQEAEARILVQNALLDEAARAKLPPDMARRAKELCDGRTRMLRYLSWYLAPFKYGTLSNYDRYFDEAAWLRTSEPLEELTGVAAQAMTQAKTP